MSATSLFHSVLTGTPSHIMDVITSYQHGILQDMFPFVNASIFPSKSIWAETKPHNPARTAEIRRQTKGVLAPWLQAHGHARLHKLFCCLPFMRAAIVEYAIWWNDLPLLCYLDVSCGGLSTFPGQLADIAVDVGNVKELQFILERGALGLSDAAIRVTIDSSNVVMMHHLIHMPWPDGRLDAIAAAVPCYDFRGHTLHDSPCPLDDLQCLVRIPWFTFEMGKWMNDAAVAGRWGLVLNMVQVGVPVDEYTLVLAARIGRLGLVQQLVPALASSCALVRAFDAAVEAYNWEIAKWVSEYVTQLNASNQPFIPFLNQ
ncbi:Aste57867_7925 [Aphanomyces stellatus]|uniref:Aste57867_7925 protein n=1 Tax=Aphanomyces stellatus TaxID=120398 RepID=A0A485KIZ2_9STRA|nr:hypothetical protein As57867_007895 [Aphanomyces stellatus]VFT84818.1 Aste57867_7925 [Aphanomyces stellatus]